ncbi:LysE family translocator [Tsuneonella sp. YG55]|uniref:LysE family translocator n=1 Tax=Tsuneonella litorea TaxID=2976475 RepID=A0A9X2W058_9SPHN|nr:LysE family translocator [Tsuneonella litorea]MCT2558089.1 LysE family translocator [Tsuneonella litorea]
MIDPERLAAFALMTTVTSIVPGVSMLFVMARTIVGGWRSGLAALLGMQIGYLAWWLLAALGLGTLAAAWPRVFLGLAIGGAAYLGWLGIRGIVHAGEGPATGTAARPGTGRRSLTDGIAVAIGNPKSLVYMVAMLPPFIDQRAAVVPQIVVLAIVAMVFDLAVGALYIGAGRRVAASLARPEVRRRADIAVGATLVVIAAGLLIDIAVR